MSALRAHFSSSSSQRTSNPTTSQPSQLISASAKSKDVGTVRQPSKLAKKSSRLPTAPDFSSRARKPTAPVVPTVMQSRLGPASISQMHNQMLASGSQSRDILSPPASVLRTPSLVSGSSISTHDSPRSNVLRRKPSTIASFVAGKRSDRIEHDRSTLHSRNEGFTEIMDDSVFGIAMPSSVAPTCSTPFSIANSESMYTTATAISNTPSTRYTDSPFSHAPTPSSFSSISTVPMAMTEPHNVSRRVSRDSTISPIEAMRQEKAASKRTSFIPSREIANVTRGDARSSYSRSAHSQVVSPRSSRIESAKPVNNTLARAQSRRSINPPELAHLSEPASMKQQPVRPSREGASDLYMAQPTSPVVQSDLPPATFHKRTSSRDSFTSSSSQGFRSRFGLSPKPSSDRGSPRIGQTMSSASSDVGSTVDPSANKLSRQTSSTTPAASPAPSKTHRFGLFTRKPKEASTKPVEKPKREPRKMPSAGTGHERYGRFGFGPRNGSVSPSIGGRSPSTESLSSSKGFGFVRRKSSGASDKSELDAFLRDRLNPVVLRGSGGNLSNAATPREDPATHEGEWPQNALGLRTSISNDPQSQAGSGVPPHTLPTSRSTTTIASTTRDVSLQGQLSQAASHDLVEGKEGLWLQPLMSEKKPARKWNFLQRLQSSPVKSRNGIMHTPPRVDLARTNFDNAAHSALMDAIEPIDLLEIERLVLEDDPAPIPPPHDIGHRVSLLPSAIEPKQKKRLSTISTSHRSIAASTVSKEASVQPPGGMQHAGHKHIGSEQPQSALRTPELNGIESPKMPRLSPIGRIPRVVSKRDQERKLPDVSFSRPFVNSQPRPNVKPPGALYNQIRELASPIEPSPQEFPSTRLVPEQSTAKRSSRDDYAMHSSTNLFAFPPRKNSELSCSSSSDTASWMAYSRLQASQDEDVWDEYDEFMDDAALGKPSTFHKTSFSSHQSPPSREVAMQETSYFGLPPTREPSHALPRPPRVSRENSNTSVPQTTQQSMYSLTRAMLSRQSTISGTSIDSSHHSHMSTHSRAASFGDANVRSSHTSFSSTAQLKRHSVKVEDTSRHAMHPSVNLKLEALMTSKLLSFGRVLFSPAHNEMRLTDEPRVLILDGLGSDWSYFVAMFYPQATIYNLGPSGKQTTARDGFQQLPNHRNIAHAALGAPLPFPRGFFTAAVFRFPVATTDQAYHACIAEFKRVLRPGGHLEVTVLDIDLGNAGDRARKAVRGLKTRMQQREANISLRSLSDFVLQSIGKRGFEEVQRCIIGVPIMCRGPQSSGRSSTSSGGRAGDASGKTLANLVESAQQEDEQNETSDEKMTKSVARVGRWWYSQCYERQVLSTDQSIWADDALLTECQAQGTSLRLLICYAQKPTQARRRTMSV